MMSTEATPRAFVGSAGDWRAGSWWELEATVFRDHPSVRQALWFRAPRDVRRAFSARHFSLWKLLGAVAELASVVLPALALMMFVSRHWVVAGQPDLVRSGLLAALAAGLAAVGMIDRRRRPETVDAKTERVVAVIHIVPSLALVVIGVLLLQAGTVDAGSAWALIGPVADIVLSVVRWRWNPPPRDVAADRALKEEARLERALAEVTPAQAAELRDEIRAAVEAARAKGLIGEEDARRALRAPLGRLGLTMAPVAADVQR